MKIEKLFILFILLLSTSILKSQDFIPLKIDSSYTYSFSISLSNDTLIEEYYSAYSYDFKDSLVQRRGPSYRANYSYSGDTLFRIIESPDSNSVWNENIRNTVIYFNGKVVSSFSEINQNNGWENSGLLTISYNASGKEALYLSQFWENTSWANFYKKESVYDMNSNKIEESEYYTDSNEEWKFNRGKLFEYDVNDHKTQEISINSSVNGPYYTGRINWYYGGNELLDSIIRCSYWGGTCKNVARAIYEYIGQDTTVKYQSSWDNEEWVYFGKVLTFKGEEIYSDKPDSILFHYYWADSMVYVPTSKWYMQYQELGDDKVYYKEERFNYSLWTESWVLSTLREEWYHIVGLNSDQNLPQESNISLFPNPCEAGGELNLSINDLSNKRIEALFFDARGRLVSQAVIRTESPIKAPKQSGFYTLVLLMDGQLAGASKIIINPD